MLTREYIGGLLAPDLGAWWLAHAGHVPDDPVSAFWALVSEYAPNGDVERTLEITHKAEGLNLGLVPMACKCLVCTEKADEDDACLYADISTSARMLANLDVELVAQYWDLPYTLYAVAVLQKRYRIRGELKVRYDAGEDAPPSSTKAERMAASSLHLLRRNNG